MAKKKRIRFGTPTRKARMFKAVKLAAAMKPAEDEAMNDINQINRGEKQFCVSPNA